MNRHIVLIHGAWQGSWAFDAWLPHLRERGWTPHAIDLPGNGRGEHADAPASLDTYCAHVCQAIERLAGPVAVLGHSGGGITASQVAEALPGRLACLVYLAGMMLPSGMSFGELAREYARRAPGHDVSGIVPYLEWTADRCATRVPADAALDIFLHDCEPEAARAAARLLTPQPEAGRAMAPSLSPGRYGRVPRIYVEALHDRSVAPALQRLMQDLSPGAQRISLACGHVPQLAQPEELARRLCEKLDALPSVRFRPTRSEYQEKP